MDGSILLHHVRGYWAPVNDSVFDNITGWLTVAVLVMAAALAVVTVVNMAVRWYRGNHRADPVLREAVDRLTGLEKLAAGRGPLLERVAAGEERIKADEKQIAWLRQSYTDLVTVIREVFVEAGQELPWETGQAKPRHLHAVKDDTRAV